ncbi:MAG TPA: hypothetical protein VIS55_02945 [Pseudomonadales bacterium]
MEAAFLMSQLPLLRLEAPRWRGPVLVLPGFMADVYRLISRILARPGS